MKQAADSVGTHDPVKCPIGRLLRTAIWEGPMGAPYDKISTKLLDAGVEFSGTEEVFPKGYAQLLKR